MPLIRRTGLIDAPSERIRRARGFDVTPDSRVAGRRNVAEPCENRPAFHARTAARHRAQAGAGRVASVRVGEVEG